MRDWGGVIGVSACALPIVVALVAVLSTWRLRRGMPARVAWWRSAAEIGAVAGTLPWIWMILTPGQGPRRMHLVPLRDLAVQLGGDPGTAVVQAGGNLLVFAALGFFAPVRVAALASPLRLAALGAAGSVVVEVTQYALDLGRVSSVDDVLLNALGAMLAGFASRRWWQDDVTRPLCTS
ncbi:VanZ family protein [Micromonospora sp. CPCC 205371]|nr:VanZ family protein [Micromonospora sp. CPCC 205371]